MTAGRGRARCTNVVWFDLELGSGACTQEILAKRILALLSSPPPGRGQGEGGEADDRPVTDAKLNKRAGKERQR